VDQGRSVGSPRGRAFPHGDDTSEMLARAEVDPVWRAGQKPCPLFTAAVHPPQEQSPAPVPHDRSGTESVRPARITSSFAAWPRQATTVQQEVQGNPVLAPREIPSLVGHILIKARFPAKT
jgi:hypothetical protein